MKNIKYLLVLFLSFIIGVSFVSANKLNSIKVNAKIDKDGTIHVTEVWDMNNNNGTEVYKQEYDLGHMYITNFLVRDESQIYTNNNSWDIYNSFEEKKYTYGINEVSDGIELCWGISEYGHKIYTISYDINDAIFITDDAQVLEKRFVNDSSSVPAKKFEVNITGFEPFKSTLGVWGFGYKGYAYVDNGKISMSNEENTSFSSNNYVTLLVKFPVNYFELKNKYRQTNMNTFDDVLRDAQEGTYKYDYDEKDDKQTDSTGVLYTIIQLAIIGLIMLIAIAKRKRYVFGPAGKTIDMKTINYFRDIPCKKDIYRAFFIAQAYELNKNETDFFGSIFLKWINENKVSIVKEEKKKLFGTKEVTSINLTNLKASGISVEDEIINMVIEASKDGVLDEKEFETYSRSNYRKVLNWFDKAETYGRNIYVGDSLVKQDKNKYIIDDKVKSDAIELAGLKKYLQEFAQMNTKQPMEVKLWKEYLMFAQIFGIADEVAKQFERLYPEVIADINNNNMSINDIIIINHMSHSAVTSASSARSAAQRYSAGGGGFSVGGGGGSFGGGGSSGTR